MYFQYIYNYFFYFLYEKNMHFLLRMLSFSKLQINVEETEFVIAYKTKNPYLNFVK